MASVLQQASKEPVAAPSPARRPVRRRLIVVAALLVTLGLGFGSAVLFGPAREQARASTLLVVDGSTGWTEALGAHSWRLHLTGATVLWFKDRPAAGSGHIAISRLVDGWAKAFAASPPYGALVVANGPDAASPAAFRITNPRLAEDGSVTFDLTADKGVSAREEARVSQIGLKDRRSRGRVSLFVVPLEISEIGIRV